MFKPVSSDINIQKVEQDVLDFWRLNRIFERSMEERKDGSNYVFYEGPPTANGKPGSHHVLARAFKDMFPRYKTMQGYHVQRRGGWDTHGLPVEIAVENELGIKHKHEIEEYGIAEFNEKCKTSVFRYITDWEKLTERIAYWVDLDQAYVTFTNDYIESVWWILRQFWDKGLIYKGYKVVPYCTRCGTPLSSHEVSQGYKDIADPSVTVRFQLKDRPDTYFLVWTTTPWTLPGNVALAVGENVDYVEVEGPIAEGEGTERLILAKALMNKVLHDPDEYKIIKTYKGKDLLKTKYNPLYTFLPVEQEYAYVVAGDFVSTTDGTGIVHMAPAFGQDDMEVGRKYDLPVLRTVNAQGEFIDAITNFRGKWFKDADPEITRDLKERGLLYKSERYTHSYPHCWRDDTPLMYFARDTWYIETTRLKDELVALNQTINWTPDHIKDGRFGNWLDDLKDWALGRERYWGTPLPIWVDDETGDMLAVGSVEELSQLAGRDLSELDLHRPHVDNITFPNPSGKGGTMHRVPEVIDVWFDSGAMPLAQWGYPHRNTEEFDAQYPADYICEAVDQTRGWFYSLHAISSLLFGKVAYKNVISLGHILDGNGQKMSKSKGNIVDPWSVLDTHGADAFRWYLYTSGPPGEPRRFSVDLVGDVIKKFWSTLWNTYSFFVTYANLDEWTLETEAPPVEERDLLDQWVLSELHALVKRVTEAYENYDVTNATRPIQDFVESLSNWYVRLSRRRFWKSEGDAEKLGAYATLYECLTTLSKLIAPAMPFLSETLYRNLVTEMDKDAPSSVHLARWTPANESLINEKLNAEMAVVQRVVSLGLAARNENEVDGKKKPIGVRQPLASAQFAFRNDDEAIVLEKFSELIKGELNVKSLKALDEEESKALATTTTTYSLNPIPAMLARRLAGDFKFVQNHLRNGEQDIVSEYAKILLAGNNLAFDLNGKSFEVTPEEVEAKVEVTVNSADGFSAVTDRGYIAGVDVRLTQDLINEGLAREVVRRIQIMRREADFNIDDNIDVIYSTTDELTSAIEQFTDYIKSETLAVKLTQGKPVNGYQSTEFTSKKDVKQLGGSALSLGVQRVTK